MRSAGYSWIVLVVALMSGCTAMMTDAKVVEHDEASDTPLVGGAPGGNGDDGDRTAGDAGVGDPEDPVDTDEEAEPVCDPVTVEDVCDTMFRLCDVQMTLTECYEHWIGDPDPDHHTVCDDETGYFGCVCQCMDAEDCESFALCEVLCWAASC